MPVPFVHHHSSDGQTQVAYPLPFHSLLRTPWEKGKSGRRGSKDKGKAGEGEEKAEVTGAGESEQKLPTSGSFDNSVKNPKNKMNEAKAPKGSPRVGKWSPNNRSSEGTEKKDGEPDEQDPPADPKDIVDASKEESPGGSPVANESKEPSQELTKTVVKDPSVSPKDSAKEKKRERRKSDASVRKKSFGRKDGERLAKKHAERQAEKDCSEVKKGKKEGKKDTKSPTREKSKKEKEEELRRAKSNPEAQATAEAKMKKNLTRTRSKGRPSDIEVNSGPSAELAGTPKSPKKGRREKNADGKKSPGQKDKDRKDNDKERGKEKIEEKGKEREKGKDEKEKKEKGKGTGEEKVKERAGKDQEKDKGKEEGKPKEVDEEKKETVRNEKEKEEDNESEDLKERVDEPEQNGEAHQDHYSNQNEEKEKIETEDAKGEENEDGNQGNELSEQRKQEIIRSVNEEKELDSKRNEPSDVVETGPMEQSSLDQKMSEPTYSKEKESPAEQGKIEQIKEEDNGVKHDDKTEDGGVANVPEIAPLKDMDKDCGDKGESVESSKEKDERKGDDVDEDDEDTHDDDDYDESEDEDEDEDPDASEVRKQMLAVLNRAKSEEEKRVEEEKRQLEMEAKAKEEEEKARNFVDVWEGEVLSEKEDRKIEEKKSSSILGVLKIGKKSVGPSQPEKPLVSQVASTKSGGDLPPELAHALKQNEERRSSVQYKTIPSPTTAKKTREKERKEKEKEKEKERREREKKERERKEREKAKKKIRPEDIQIVRAGSPDLDSREAPVPSLSGSEEEEARLCKHQLSREESREMDAEEATSGHEDMGKINSVEHDQEKDSKREKKRTKSKGNADEASSSSKSHASFPDRSQSDEEIVVRTRTLKRDPIHRLSVNLKDAFSSLTDGKPKETSKRSALTADMSEKAESKRSGSRGKAKGSAAKADADKGVEIRRSPVEIERVKSEGKLSAREENAVADSISRQRAFSADGRDSPRSLATAAHVAEKAEVEESEKKEEKNEEIIKELKDGEGDHNKEEKTQTETDNESETVNAKENTANASPSHTEKDTKTADAHKEEMDQNSTDEAKEEEQTEKKEQDDNVQAKDDGQEAVSSVSQSAIDEFVRFNSDGTPTPPPAIMKEATEAEKICKSKVPECNTSQERDRLLVLQETINTERDFVDDLTTIIQLFQDPLEKNGILSEEEMEILFCNLRVIFDTNKEVLSQFDDRVIKAGSVDILIGDIFISMANHFKQYTSYCINQDSQNKLYVELKQGNRPFAEFSSHAKMDPRCRRLELPDMLIKPMQRLCKYPLLLRELIKKTDEDHADYASLLEAKDKIGDVVSYVNERKRVGENQAKIVDIQHSIEGCGPLLEPDRRFIRSGHITTVEGGKKHKRVFYLFNDICLLSKPKAKGFVSVADSELKTEIFLDLMPLNDVRVIDMADTSDAKNAFELRRKTMSVKPPYLVSCVSGEEKRSWLKDIKNVVKEHQRAEFLANKDRLVRETEERERRRIEFQSLQRTDAQPRSFDNQDAWMMGIILFYMYTGQPLFEGLSFPQAAISYMTRTYPPQIDEKMRQSMPRDILNLIEDCWRDSDGCSENFSMIYDRIQLLDMEYPPGFDRKGKIEGAESSGLSTQILPHSHAHSHSTSGGDKKEEKEKEKEKDGGLKLGGGFSKWGKR